MLFPACPHPVTQASLADPEFPRHLRDSTRGLDDHPGRFLTELRREVPVFYWHLIPSFPVKILKDPQSGRSRAPHRQLAERHEVHRRTVRQALASALPPPRKQYARRSRATDARAEVIDGWLIADQGLPGKQRRRGRR